MTVEVMVLGLSALLACAQLALAAAMANRQLGSSYLAGPRDEGVRLTGIAGRLRRACYNQLEGLVLFAVAVTVLTFADRAHPFTQLAAVIYLAARLVYVPLYAFGVRWWRSAVWTVGWLATVFILLWGLLG
ncbi:MAG: MAPEG family protein [Alphaproteobacteria bacterium]|nr:MAG: MAPEG family protein [Alphaproteobacteria bacterium]